MRTKEWNKKRKGIGCLGVHGHAGCKHMVQMCLLASLDMCLQLGSMTTSPPRGGCRWEKGDRIYPVSNLQSFICHWSKTTPRRVIPLNFRVHCWASPMFHLSVEEAKHPRDTCSTHLSLQQTSGSWQMLNEIWPHNQRRKIAFVCGNDLVNVFFHQFGGLMKFCHFRVRVAKAHCLPSRQQLLLLCSLL